MLILSFVFFLFLFFPDAASFFFRTRGIHFCFVTTKITQSAGWRRGPDQALPSTASRVRVAHDGPDGLRHGERQVNKEDQVRRGRGRRECGQHRCGGQRRGGVGRRLGFIIASEGFQTEAALRYVL